MLASSLNIGATNARIPTALYAPTLHVTTHKLLGTSYESRAISYESRATSYELRATSDKPEIPTRSRLVRSDGRAEVVEAADEEVVEDGGAARE